MKTIGLFPGQGSQAVGMGKAFFEASKEVREMFAEADDTLGYSLSKLCLEGPLETLTLTENAQPAILLVSSACFRLADLPIDVAAGHSLGEYSALVAAGALSLGTAVKLVHRRGRYMQEAVRPGEGRMMAVMGPTPPEIEDVLKQVTSGICQIANLNCPGQTVVAGDVTGVEKFQELMGQTGAKLIPLNVSAPFHCQLMAPAAEKLAKDLDAIDIADPKFPIYCNVTAKAVGTKDEIRTRLKEQVCGSVRWTESMENAIRETGVTRSIEFGAGGVLTKLLKRINSTVTRYEIDSPDSLAKVRTGFAA